MRTTPTRMKPTPRTKGGPTPNHDVPDSELAGYHRLSSEAIRTQVRASPPSSGNSPSSRNFLTLSKT